MSNLWSTLIGVKWILNCVGITPHCLRYVQPPTAPLSRTDDLKREPLWHKCITHVNCSFKNTSTLPSCSGGGSKSVALPRFCSLPKVNGLFTINPCSHTTRLWGFHYIYLCFVQIPRLFHTACVSQVNIEDLEKNHRYSRGCLNFPHVLFQPPTLLQTNHRKTLGQTSSPLVS